MFNEPIYSELIQLERGPQQISLTALFCALNAMIISHQPTNGIKEPKKTTQHEKHILATKSKNKVFNKILLLSKP